MKKVVALALVVLSVLALFAGCAGEQKDNDQFKFGMITLHGEESTYDKNFIEGAKQAVKELGLKDSQFILKTGIDEKAVCYETAVDLIDAGCDLIFADSFGHESFLLQAAKEHKNVQFCHATGTMAHTEKLDNFHNAFAEIYEGRYLAGVAAGLKLKELYDAGAVVNGTKVSKEGVKIGYVGAYTYAEVISGYTSFYLGVKSVLDQDNVPLTMDVRFTGSWYDVTLEKEAAEALIADGCVLISQHADSMGAPSACETAGVPNVSYNGSTAEACPNTFIISSRIDWTPYFKYIIGLAMEGKGKEIATDWTGTIDTGSVVLTELGPKAPAAGTAAKLEEVKAKLKAGTLNVFDTNNFTVGGAKLTTYKADVDTDDAFTPDTEVIANGVFEESKYRSAPYFDVRIDGINLKNEKY